MAPTAVRVRVPASTSNFGPGFDCLGCALELYNTVEVSRLKPGHEPPDSASAMITESVAAFFARATDYGVTPFAVGVRIGGEIPIARGLGSSVSVRAGLLLGLAELVRAESPIERVALLRWLIQLEGHPDNAVPSWCGGFAICAPASAESETGYTFTRVAVGRELAFITLIPKLRLTTEQARALLPEQISHRHAVENLQRAARITASFVQGDYLALRGLFIDHLHEPFRERLIPGFVPILKAARLAGALGSFLSGAGTCFMALALDHEEAIGEAMRNAASEHGLEAEVKILRADNEGAILVPSSEVAIAEP